MTDIKQVKIDKSILEYPRGTKQYQFRINENTYDTFIIKWKMEEIIKRLGRYYFLETCTLKKLKGFEISFTRNNSFVRVENSDFISVLRKIASIFTKEINKGFDFFFFEATQSEDSRVDSYSSLSKLITKKYPEYSTFELYSPDLDSNMFLFYKPDRILFTYNY